MRPSNLDLGDRDGIAPGTASSSDIGAESQQSWITIILLVCDLFSLLVLLSCSRGTSGTGSTGARRGK